MRIRLSMAAAALAVTLSNAASAASLSTEGPSAIPAMRRAVEVTPVGPSAGAPIVFVDAMQQAAPWTSARPLSLDPAGEITALAPGQTADRVVFVQGQRHPTGDYTLLYDGAATFDVAGGAIVRRAPGSDIVRVTAPLSGLSVRLVATSPTAPAHRIRLVLPGFLATYATQPFYPPFVASFAGVDAIRFDGWSRAATLATSQTWTLRPRVFAATQANESGVAPEYQISLANATGADPWFVLPMGATDEYVYGVADLAHKFLDPRLHAMFEYGDRPWLAGTPANAYARMAARNLELASDPSAGALEWYGRRSAQVFSIVDSAFGSDRDRVSGVLSMPGADRSDGAAADAMIESAAGAGSTMAIISVDAGSDAGNASTVAGLPLAGAATQSWRPVSAGWIGTGMPPRESVSPAAGLTLRIGDDVYPSPSDGARLGVALHPTALVQSRIPTISVNGPASLAGALGQPLENVDLTREGGSDWIAADGFRPGQSKAAGGHRIEVSILGGREGAASAGYSTLSWSDGYSPRSGSAAGGLELSGSGAGFAVIAPASSATQVLRVYVGADAATVTAIARIGNKATSFAPLYSSGSPRDGVYTFVYRSASAGSLAVEFSAEGGRGGAVFRGATLRPLTNAGAPALVDETTYHNDQLRTGWDPDETILDTKNVASAKFGLLRTLHVDGNVLAQPLYVGHVTLRGHGVHNLLVVATEHDSIYEFDADTGAYLRKASMGPSQSSEDVGCGDISPEYGITSTPVIDLTTDTLYLVAATEPAPFVFHTKIHALDLKTLTDKVTPQEIEASTVISNGTKISYDPQNQQTRTSLTWSEGSLYVGVGSHCDNNAGAITGWELRYDSSLRQTGRFATTEDSTGYFLDSIWMAGFAAAVDSAGNIFVVTGNGAFDVNHGGHNYGESVLKLTPTLTRVLSIFTPANWRTLNAGDIDFGSGGVMLLPPQQASVKYVAVAQGKWSTIYLLDRSKLGGLHSGDSGALQSIQGTGGGVWGGPAYYSGPTGQFVYYQSGGSPLTAYSVAPDQSGVPQLTLASSGPSYAGYGGSTPVVSSDGQEPGTGIVWLVNRSRPLVLEAYDASDVSRLLFSGDAGIWQNPANNGFVTPLVAKGRVYVPATGTISVFGLSDHAVRPATIATVESFEHRIFGTIAGVTENSLALRLRDGRVISIDLASAISARHTGVLPVGHAVVVYGYIDRFGIVHATSIGHASPDPKDWSADE